MELTQAIAQRRMTRSFRGDAVAVDLLRTLCEQALRAPTAGNSAGVRCTILPIAQVNEFFEIATDETWRATSPRYEGLARAGAVVVMTSRPQDYEARYRAHDKELSGLGKRDQWPLPYWHTDAAMATMNLLLLLEEQGLGAAFWGSFRYADALLSWAGISDEELFCSVLIGVPDGKDHRSASLDRETPTRAERVRVR